MPGRGKRELSEHGKKAFGGQGVARDQELMQLRRELAQVKKERDFLKDAASDCWVRKCRGTALDSPEAAGPVIALQIVNNPATRTLKPGRRSSAATKSSPERVLGENRPR